MLRGGSFVRQRALAAAALVIGVAFPVVTSAEPADDRGAVNRAIESFLESVGCSQLPMGSCEALNADNARSLLIARKILLFRKFCALDPDEAVQLAGVEGGLDGASDRPACKALIDLEKRADGVQIHAN
jgi:hypothetical protein